MRSPIPIIFFLCFLFDHSDGQTQSFQFFTDFAFNTPLKNHFSWENQATYRTNINTTKKWRMYQAQTLITKSLGSSWEVMASLLANYTDQTTTVNTTEIRPWVGVRYHIFRDTRFNLAGLFRYEFRNIYTYDSATWFDDDRLRLRLEASYLVAGERISAAHAWYVLSDAEIFYTIDRELNERYASRIRFRIGMGHNVTRRWRFEALYAYQNSRNTLKNGGYKSTYQDILWFRTIFITK